MGCTSKRGAVASTALRYLRACATWSRQAARLLLCGSSDCSRRANWEEWLCATRRLTWVAAITVCAYFTAAQVKDCWDLLRDPSTTTQVHINVQERITYPAITFCYKNKADQGYDLRMLKHFNITSYWINVRFDENWDIYTDWWDFPWEESDLTAFWTWSTYRFYGDSDYKNCSTSENGPRPPGMPAESRIVFWAISLNMDSEGVVLDHPRFYYDHGLCQTFRPDPAAEELPPPGETRGYKFHFMYIPCEDPVGEYEEGEELLPGGMDVFIHDALEWWTENPSFFYNGEHLFVPNGKEVFIKLTESNFYGLNKEGSPCEENRGDDSVYNSYTECVEKCRWDFLAGMPDKRCDAPFMPVLAYPECDSYTTATGLFDIYQQWSDPASNLHCKDRCTLPCHLKAYYATILKEEDMEFTQSTFHIYYPNGQSQDLMEEFSYDQTSFIADLGGILGFLLGISVLSVLEILEWTALTCIELHKRWKLRKLERQGQRQQDGRVQGVWRNQSL